MNPQILTSTQAKDARTALGLSQGKVSTELGINRSYLSQFESGRYLFPDDDLVRLRDFFKSEGYAFTEPLPPEPEPLGPVNPSVTDGYRVMDGFVIPPAVTDEDAEIMLSEYAENIDEINKITASDAKYGFFGGLDTEHCAARSKAVQGLMARNFTLIEMLQGHHQNIIFPCDEHGLDDDPETIGDFMGQRAKEQEDDLEDYFIF